MLGTGKYSDHKKYISIFNLQSNWSILILKYTQICNSEDEPTECDSSKIIDFTLKNAQGQCE